jgi:hypothetical protein
MLDTVHEISHRIFLVAELQDELFDQRDLIAFSRVVLSVDNATPLAPA